MSRVGLFMLLGAMACSGSLDRNDFITWTQSYDNGMHVRQKTGGFVFDVQYQPAAYIWLQRNPDAGIQSFERDVKEIEALQYYTLTIGVEGSGVDFMEHNVVDEEAKKQREYYFSYSFQSDLSVEEEGRKLSCVLYHFEKPVDEVNTRTFVLGFENPFPASEMSSFIIESKELGVVPIKIEISKKNIPTLKL